MKLMPYVVNEARWPIQIDRLFPSDQHPQQAIKTDEMVDREAGARISCQFRQMI
jgi:hypothetical protein